MTSLFPLAGRLFTARRTTAAGRIDALAVMAFAIATALLEAVLGGVHLFYQRWQNPPEAFASAMGSRAEAIEAAPFWLILAGIASVLLVVPLVSLSASAARMGALGRDRRLAALRLLGATPSEVVGLTALETMLQALVGALVGTVLYLVTLPAWSLISFQGTPLGASEMMLPWWALIGIVVGVLLVSGASGVAGLRRVRISPLGVARMAPAKHGWLLRVMAFGGVVVGWIAIQGWLRLQDGIGIIIAVMLVFLGMFMGVINVIGPLVLRLLARLLAQGNSPERLLAARRLLADPGGAWRAVSGLAFVGFVAGMLLAMPPIPTENADPLTLLVAVDIPVGTVLTLVISFVVAAASTSLNQVAAIFDRRTHLVHLDHAGAPRSLFGRLRLVEVLAPTALASVGSAGLAVIFLLPIQMVGGAATGLPTLGLVLIGGLALVAAASEACRPALASVLANAGPRVE